MTLSQLAIHEKMYAYVFVKWNPELKVIFVYWGPSLKLDWLVESTLTLRLDVAALWLQWVELEIKSRDSYNLACCKADDKKRELEKKASGYLGTSTNLY